MFGVLVCAQKTADKETVESRVVEGEVDVEVDEAEEEVCLFGRRHLHSATGISSGEIKSTAGTITALEATAATTTTTNRITPIRFDSI